MRKVIFVIIMVFAGVLSGLAQQEWQSTSVMQGAGSTLSPQVTAVCAASVDEMASTADKSYSAKAPKGIKKSSLGLPTVPDTKDDPGNVPLGDAVLPLMLLVCAYVFVRTLRRRKSI